MFSKLALVIFLVFVPLSPIYAVQYWPTTIWKAVSPQSLGFSPNPINKMFRFIQKKQFPIDSVVIVKNGYLIGEFYAGDMNENSLSNIYSVTKSFTSALVGIAIDKGYIKNEKQTLGSMLTKNLSIKKDPRLNEIQLQHLLTMTSGLKTRDNFLSNWSGIIKLKNSKNWVDYILSLGTEKKSGEQFNYSNGGSHLLAAIVTENTKTALEKFAERHLFSHIGIKNYEWQKDPQGINHGYSNLKISARDMAKLGILYLNEGRWGKRQVINSSWVKKSLKTHSYPNKGKFNPLKFYGFNGYGYQWWNSKTVWKADLIYRKTWGMGKNSKKHPDYFFALGYQGQYIFILPQLDMVVVFKSRFKKSRDNIIPKAIIEEFILN